MRNLSKFHENHRNIVAVVWKKTEILEICTKIVQMLVKIVQKLGKTVEISEKECSQSLENFWNCVIITSNRWKNGWNIKKLHVFHFIFSKISRKFLKFLLNCYAILNNFCNNSLVFTFYTILPHFQIFLRYLITVIDDSLIFRYFLTFFFFKIWYFLMISKTILVLIVQLQNYECFINFY